MKSISGINKFRISTYLYATAKTDKTKTEIRRFQNCKTQHHKNGVFLPFYCNSIFCINCEKRKYKKVFQKYKKIIENRQNTHFYYFLTIAPKRTDGRQLQTAIDQLRHGNKKIRYYTQQLFLGGINRLELSYSPITRTYKPHFHTILESKKQLTEKQLKNYLFRIAPKFTTLEIELQTEKNRFGNTSFIMSNTEIDLNLQEIKKGTELDTLSYITKATELFYNSENVLELINGIKDYTRFFSSWGTLKKETETKTKTKLNYEETKTTTEKNKKEIGDKMAKQTRPTQTEKIDSS